MINLNLPPMESYWVSPAQREYFIVHWGDGYTPTNAAEEQNLVRSYDNYHRNTQGWGGIGYNLCVGPATGEVYMGRGLDAVGAHSPNRNFNGIGVCVLGSPTVVTDAIKRGLREAYRIACEHTSKKLQINVHRNSPGNYTTCPGDALTAWVMSGGITKPEAPKKETPKRKRKEMHLIHIPEYVQGHWVPKSTPLYALVGPGYFQRITNPSRANALAVIYGPSVKVSHAEWNDEVKSALLGSNDPGYAAMSLETKQTEILKELLMSQEENRG